MLNRFLSYTAFLLKITHLSAPPFGFHSLHPAVLKATIVLPHPFYHLNGSIDASDLLSSISFHVPSHDTRNHCLFKLPHHRTTSYGQNHPLQTMLGDINKFSSDHLFCKLSIKYTYICIYIIIIFSSQIQPTALITNVFQYNLTIKIYIICIIFIICIMDI